MTGVKKEIRRILIDRDCDLGLDIHSDDINAVTNAIYKVVRPHLKEAGL